MKSFNQASLKDNAMNKALIIFLALAATVKTYTAPYGDTVLTIGPPWLPTFDGARSECARDATHDTVLACAITAKARESSGIRIMAVPRCDFCEEFGVWIGSVGQDPDIHDQRTARIDRAIRDMN